MLSRSEVLSNGVLFALLGEKALFIVGICDLLFIFGISLVVYLLFFGLCDGWCIPEDTVMRFFVYWLEERLLVCV